MNAAFGQHKTNDEMGNTDSFQVSPSISHSLATTTNEPANQQKTVKLSRTLTEKRKDYVRRVSAVKQTVMPDLSNDSMHQTFKPSVLRTFSIDNDDETNHNDSIITSNNNNSGKQHCTSPKSGAMTDEWRNIDRNGNVSDGRRADAQSPSCSASTVIDDMAGLSDKDLMTYDESVDNVTKLFQVCLLVGFNNSTRQAYIKSKFPANEEIPPNIEQLVFPSPNLINQTRKNQDYSIILTDNNGYHVYGYCRRVLPESSEICLPLAYCIISEVNINMFISRVISSKY